MKRAETKAEKLALISEINENKPELFSVKVVGINVTDMQLFVGALVRNTYITHFEYSFSKEILKETSLAKKRTIQLCNQIEIIIKRNILHLESCFTRFIL